MSKENKVPIDYWEKQKRKEKIKDILYRVVAISIMVFPFVMYYFDGSGADNSYDFTLSCTVAKQEVVKKLKAPSSASFPSCNDMNIYPVGDEWTVSSYVEAQNTFGVMLKSKSSSLIFRLSQILTIVNSLGFLLFPQIID